MEENTKRKIEVTIAGITISLVTDESESFVNTVISRMDSTMSALLSKNVKRSRLDAAMLCAIDFCGDKILAEKRVRNLEAQISLYDVNLRRLKDENAALRKKLEGDMPEEKKEEKIGAHIIGEQISIGDSVSSASEVGSAAGKTAETSPANNSSADTSADNKSDVNSNGESENVSSSQTDKTRGDKIKMIEALLKK